LKTARFKYKIILSVRLRGIEMEITSMSTRGQVVIPLGIRESLGIKEGEKFIVLGEEDTIILKKIEAPSFKNFENLLKKTREFSKNKSIKQSDVKQAVKSVRKT
ncbi:MAG: AbrB/MazE/SpoVT family DNA-binding domain-containing protein, partial [Candidatus Woesearchaeota archaeon]